LLGDAMVGLYIRGGSVDSYDVCRGERTFQGIPRAGMRLFSLLHTSTFYFFFVVHYEYLRYRAQGARRSLAAVRISASYIGK
jgi:hypothetical protein